MPTALEDEQTTVHFGGRIPEPLRRRVRVTSAQDDIPSAEILTQALEEYLGIPADLRRRIARAAAEDKLDVHDVRQRALTEYLARREG